MPSNEKWLTLDGNRYAIVGRVQRFALDPLASPIRTIGRQQQSDVSLASEFIFGTPIYGLGQSRITDLDDRKQLRRIWHSVDMMTHYSAQTTLGLLAEDSTEITQWEVLRAATSFKGELRALLERDGGAAQKNLISVSYDGGTTTWTSPTGILEGDSATENVGLDIISHKDRMIALYARTNDHIARFATEASTNTWVAATTAIALNLLSDSVTANEDIDAGLLASIGGEAVAIIWHEANGTITFYSSANAGVDWTDEGIDIASGNGPQGVAVIVGPDGKDKLIVFTREGIWQVDTEPGTWTTRLIHPMTPNNDNGRRATVHGSVVWFGMGVDDDTPAGVGILYATQDGWRVEENVSRGVFYEQGIYYGPAAGDTCDSTLLGPIRWWKSAGGLLFFSAGGGKAGRNAWIGVHTGLGWHVFYTNPTANQKIEWIDVSADDDANVRLHFVVRTAADNHDAKFLGKPLSNPKDGQSYKYQADGAITRPEFDGGMPRYDAAWLKYFSAAIKLVAGDEEINIDYDIEDSGSFTDWGDITPTVSELDLAEGAGVAGKSIITKENYARGSTNTLSPFGRETGLVYDKHVPLKEGFEFLLDMAGTADAWQKGVEDVITALMKAAGPPATDATATLKEFTYPGLDSTKYVKVHNLTFKEAPDDPDNPLDMSQRVGNALVQVREKA
ncbi:MAG: hypothetical protein V3W51_04575 [Candidatus Brocadiales bacterium]